VRRPVAGSAPDAPWTVDELAAAVRERLPEATGVVADRTGTGLVVELAEAEGREARWRLTFPGMLAGLGGEPLTAAALIVRANVQEWCEVRDRYPDGLPGMTVRWFG
jgi:hypothetical protein